MAEAKENETRPEEGKQDTKPADAKKDAKPADAKKEPKALTAADVAKLVKREITTYGKDGKPNGTKEVAVTAAEVLSFKEYDEHVVVVTNDGRKLSGAKAGK
jgi:hypothetical protein